MRLTGVIQSRAATNPPCSSNRERHFKHDDDCVLASNPLVQSKGVIHSSEVNKGTLQQQRHPDTSVLHNNPQDTADRRVVELVPGWLESSKAEQQQSHPAAARVAQFRSQHIYDGWATSLCNCILDQLVQHCLWPALWCPLSPRCSKCYLMHCAAQAR
jgi:hypothetical protein